MGYENYVKRTYVWMHQHTYTYTRASVATYYVHTCSHKGKYVNMNVTMIIQFNKLQKNEGKREKNSFFSIHSVG